MEVYSEHSFSTHIQSNRIIGIDFGNENIVLSIYQNEGIDIIDSFTGKHSIPNCVYINKKELKCGIERNCCQVKRSPKNCIVGLKKLIQFHDLEIKQKEDNFSFVLCDENGMIQLGELGDVCIECVLIELFKTIKEIARADYCVIAISSKYSFEEKSIIEECCSIAQIPCLQVVSDSICIGMYYWTYNLISQSKEEGHVQLFLDIGNSETTCSVFKFYSNQIQLIATKTIEIGGRDYSVCIRNKFLELLNEREEYKEFVLGLTGNKRNKFFHKIQGDIDNFKFIFSSKNIVESILRVELTSSDEFIEVIPRSEFESWCDGYNNGICQLVEEVNDICFRRIGIRPTRIELVGGGSRLDCIGSTLENKLHLDIMNTMNKESVIGKGAGIISVQVGMKLGLLREIDENFMFVSIEQYVEKESIRINSVKYPKEDCLTEFGEIFIERNDDEIIKEIWVNGGCIGTLKEKEIHSKQICVGLERWLYCYQPYDYTIKGDDYLYPFQCSSNVEKNQRQGQYKANWITRNYIRGIREQHTVEKNQIMVIEEEILLNNEIYSEERKGNIEKEVKRIEEIQKRINECVRLKILFETYVNEKKDQGNDQEKEDLFSKKKQLRKIMDDVDEIKRIIGNSF